MDLRLLRAYVTMQPVLQAQEALQAITIAAAGGGHMKKASQDRVMTSLRKLAQRREVATRRATAAARSPEQEAATMRRLGFNVTLVPKPVPQEGQP